MKNTMNIGVAGIALVSTLVAGRAGAQVFVGLQNAPNNAFAAPSVSGDGTTVVGKAGSIMMRWRVSTGLEAIPLSRSESQALDVSHNGSVIAGNFQDDTVGYLAFGYSSTGEFSVPFRGGVRISADGSTFAGNARAEPYRAQVFQNATNTTTTIPAGMAPPGVVYFNPVPSDVGGVSANGMRVVGTSLGSIEGGPSGRNMPMPFIWDSLTGTRYITNNDGSRFLGPGLDMSDDGTVALVGGMG